jgi:hypothetical protein
MSTLIRNLPYGGFVLGVLLALFLNDAIADRSHRPRPVRLEEIAKVSPPGPSGQVVRRVALSDRYLLMATRRNFDRPEGAWSEQFAHLFRRRGHGSWIHVRTLVTTSAPNQETPVMAIDLRDRIAAVNAGQLTIFELTGSRWTEAGRLPSGGNLDLEIDSGTIVVSEPGCAWEAFRKIDGTWKRAGVALSSNTCNQSPGFGEDIDIAGDRIVVANPFISNAQGTQWPSRVRVFESLSSSTPAAFITDPSGEEASPFGIPVAVDNGTVFAADGATVFAFETDSGGMWNKVAALEPPDAPLLMFAGAVQSRDGLTAVGYPSDPQRASVAGSVGVFRRDAVDSYTEVARLLATDASDSAMLGTDVDVDDAMVVAAARDAAYIFQLPARLLKRK